VALNKVQICKEKLV